MKLIHRFGYYFGGFTIGILLLLFFLGGKRASCDYGPNARTLKNIRLKERAFSENTLRILAGNQLDTSAISYLLQKGDVVFSESNTKLDSCKQYVIEGTVRTEGQADSEKNLKIRVENCEELATVMEAEIQN